MITKCSAAAMCIAYYSLAVYSIVGTLLVGQIQDGWVFSTLASILLILNTLSMFVAYLNPVEIYLQRVRSGYPTKLWLYFTANFVIILGLIQIHWYATAMVIGVTTLIENETDFMIRDFASKNLSILKETK